METSGRANYLADTPARDGEGRGAGSSDAPPSRVVVVEYPKSGGSWVVGVLADALGLPKRDIYIGDGVRTAFDLATHPWYAGAASRDVSHACVVKSHELPDSPLTRRVSQPGTATVHLIRDGRDVTVSKYFFERDFCVRNGILPSFDLSFGAYVAKTAAEWRAFVSAWSGRANVECRYEAFLEDPVAAAMTVLDAVGRPVAVEAVRAAVAANTRERFARSLDATFAHNTFVRVGRSGDWANHFGPADRAAFARAAGELLRSLGYVDHATDWAADAAGNSADGATA